MAMLFCDSFDHYTTQYLSAKGWTAAGGVTIETASGRAGGGALKIVSGASTPSLTRRLKNTATGIIGFACFISAYPATKSPMLVFRDGATGQCVLYLRTDGTVEMVSGGVSIGISSKTLPLAAYFYLEIKLIVSSTAGGYEIRVNESFVLKTAENNFTTQQSANAYFNAISFQTNADGGWYYLVDDLYLNDTLPSTYGALALPNVNVDFLGDVQVKVLYPDADGTYTDFVPSTGTDHYALLDEPLLDESGYVTSQSTTGLDIEQVSYPEPDSGTERIFAIQPVAAVKLGAMQPVSVSLALFDPGIYGGQGGWLFDDWMSDETVIVGTAMQMMHGVLNFNPTLGDYWTPLWVGYFEFGIRNNGTA
jgi:hypothetical protein